MECLHGRENWWFVNLYLLQFFLWHLLKRSSTIGLNFFLLTKLTFNLMRTYLSVETPIPPFFFYQHLIIFWQSGTSADYIFRLALHIFEIWFWKTRPMAHLCRFRRTVDIPRKATRGPQGGVGSFSTLLLEMLPSIAL